VNSYENNIVDLAGEHLIVHLLCTNVKYFNNTDSAGKLIQGENLHKPGDIFIKQDELATIIEDAELLSML